MSHNGKDGLHPHYEAPRTASPPSRFHSLSPSTSNSSPYPRPMSGYTEGPNRTISPGNRFGQFRSMPEYPLVINGQPQAERPKLQLLGPGVSIREGDEGVIPQAVVFDGPVFRVPGELEPETHRAVDSSYPRVPPEQQFERPAGGLGLNTSKTKSKVQTKVQTKSSDSSRVQSSQTQVQISTTQAGQILPT
ncbi:hypothetical protein CJU89_5914 [Yarrowia sp. B02]|nr:hypothetical protein CJU89_5914 [Yarrowia sp. B02]